MSPELMQQLVDAGFTWTLTYYPSLLPDPEIDFVPADHFVVTIVTSYEDQVESWGPTADAAARDALRQIALN